jgi:hypothetical protein
MQTAFALEIARRAFSAAYSDMGTNGLGWFVAIVSPVFIAIRRGLFAPRGSKLSTILNRWRTELRDAVLLGIGFLMVIAAWEAFWKIPHQINRLAATEKLPLQTWPIPSPPYQDRIPVQATLNRTEAPVLKARLVDPMNLALIVNNESSEVAEGIAWGLVTFRKSDDAFFSFQTQNMGYVKPHSSSPPYSMDLGHILKAPNDGAELRLGDTIVGGLTVDCPKCKGMTYAVSISYGRGGWYCPLPQAKGGMLFPKSGIPASQWDTAVRSYINVIEAFCTSSKQIIIQPR